MEPTMRLGLSRPVEYLAGTPGHLLTRLYGDADACLARWREWGISTIELRRVGEETPPEDVALAARRVWNAGLSLTLHARFPRQAAGTTLEALFPGLAALLPELRERHDEVVVPVHAYASREESESSLAASTRDVLLRSVEAAEREGVPLRFAMELNRSKGQTDPSTTYEGALALVAGVSPAGICWDFGHAWSNARRGLLAEAPPAAFIEAAAHTHIHDVGPDGGTHWPLTQGAVPVESYVAMLASAGYRGILCLELSEERFAGQVDAPEALQASITRLQRSIIGMAGPEPPNRC